MKKLLLMIAFLFALMNNQAQTIFWTENFGTNPVCQSLAASGYSQSANGTWTVNSTGTNGAFGNLWYVSAAEAGMGVGNCGDGCMSNPTLTNRTLHISSFVDLGAAYGAGPLSITHLRAESPTINCTGQSSITLKLNYIMGGIINQDFAQVMYSPDNGVTWSNLGTPVITPTTAACSGQAVWASYSVALPASANNNPIVKIGFNWQNVNATGSDPSVAIDDISLTSASSSTITLVPTFTIQTPICKGDSVQVTANTGTTTATGYTWTTNPAGPLIATPNASVTWVKFNTSGTYSVILTAAAGTVVASTNNTILVNPSPTIGVSAPIITICSGKTTTLTATGGVSYTWTPGNLNGTPVVVSPTANTNYVCTGTSSLGCKSTTMISIFTIPLPTISVSSTTMNVCIGSSATLSATGGISYTWTPGSTTGSSVVVSPTVITTYLCTGSSAAACTNSTVIVITVTDCSTGSTGLNANTGILNSFSLYPNPMNDKLTILAGENMSNAKIEIVDILGKTLLSNEYNIINAGASQAINTSALPKGIYFVNIKANGKDQLPIKVIKE